MVHIQTYNVYLNIVNHAISTEIFYEKRPLQQRKNKIPPWPQPPAAQIQFDQTLKVSFWDQQQQQQQHNHKKYLSYYWPDDDDDQHEQQLTTKWTTTTNKKQQATTTKDIKLWSTTNNNEQ